MFVQETVDGLRHALALAQHQVTAFRNSQELCPGDARAHFPGIGIVGGGIVDGVHDKGGNRLNSLCSPVLNLV